MSTKRPLLRFFKCPTISLSFLTQTFIFHIVWFDVNLEWLSNNWRQNIFVCMMPFNKRVNLNFCCENNWKIILKTNFFSFHLTISWVRTLPRWPVGARSRFWGWKYSLSWLDEPFDKFLHLAHSAPPRAGPNAKIYRMVHPIMTNYIFILKSGNGHRRVTSAIRHSAEYID